MISIYYFLFFICNLKNKKNINILEMKKSKKYNYNMLFEGILNFVMSKSKKIKKILISSGLFVTASFPLIGASIVNNITMSNSKQGTLSNSSNTLQKINDSLNDDISTTSGSSYRLDTSTANEGYSLLKVLDNDGNDSGIAIKLPNFSNSSKKAQSTASQILAAYNSIPSNIVTTGSSSNILNIINIDTSKWKSTSDSSNPSKIFNLGATSTYNNNYRNNSSGSAGSSGGSSTTTPTSFDYVSSTSQLPAFNQVSTNVNETTTNTPVTQDYLDNNGILALQITVTSASTTSGQQANYQSYYLLIPGFGGSLNNNAMSNNPMLPSDYYSSGVSSVSNENLIKFLSDSYSSTSESDRPNISISSRDNNNLQGILNFTSTFAFLNNSGISFNNGFAGVTDSNVSSLSSTTGKNVSVVSTTTSSSSYTNTYTNTAISYDLNFTVSGFQPMSAVSDSNVMIITGAIIVTVVIFCIVAYLVTKAAKIIRYKHAL